MNNGLLIGASIAVVVFGLGFLLFRRGRAEADLPPAPQDGSFRG